MANISMTETLCPCGSNLPYAGCCGRFHSGQPAPTAEALMRSRYSSFALRDAAYLARTLHPSKRQPNELQHIEQSFGDTRWTGLVILDRSDGQVNDDSGVVEFIAHYQSGGQRGQLQERSRFVRENGAWLYVDGAKGILPAPGRNDPCWCGSGKKSKKCHG